MVVKMGRAHFPLFLLFTCAILTTNLFRWCVMMGRAHIPLFLLFTCAILMEDYVFQLSFKVRKRHYNNVLRIIYLKKTTPKIFKKREHKYLKIQQQEHLKNNIIINICKKYIEKNKLISKKNGTISKTFICSFLIVQHWFIYGVSRWVEHTFHCFYCSLALFWWNCLLRCVKGIMILRIVYFKNNSKIFKKTTTRTFKNYINKNQKLY